MDTRNLATALMTKTTKENENIFTFIYECVVNGRTWYDKTRQDKPRRNETRRKEHNHCLHRIISVSAWDFETIKE